MGSTSANRETPMARAWKQAAQDLGFEFVSPFAFVGNDGREYECSGLLKFFGNPNGTLICSRFDRDCDKFYEVINGLGFYSSALNPRYYEKYDRARFMETLRDWRWYGPEDRRPDWL
jgi:hypothetical protein